MASETNLEATLAECLSQQLCEIELLESMYPNSDDIVFTDRNIIEEITNFLNTEAKTEFLPNHIDFILNLSVNTNKVEIYVNLPSFYPNEDPDIYIRCNQLNRQQETALNVNLSKFIKAEKQEGEVCVYTAISWVQEHLEEFISITIEVPEHLEPQPPKSEIKFCRYWIYSHHIYNKRKREVIVNVAKDYNLTGVCLPGKPGVICVEGDEDDCKEWWKIVKAMTWKRIVLRKTDIFEQSEREQQQRFDSFQEVNFTCKTSKHPDMGEFCKYMEKFGLGADINEFFGLCNTS